MGNKPSSFERCMKDVAESNAAEARYWQAVDAERAFFGRPPRLRLTPEQVKQVVKEALAEVAQRSSLNQPVEHTTVSKIESLTHNVNGTPSLESRRNKK